MPLRSTNNKNTLEGNRGTIRVYLKTPNVTGSEEFLR